MMQTSTPLTSHHWGPATLCRNVSFKFPARTTLPVPAVAELRTKEPSSIFTEEGSEIEGRNDIPAGIKLHQAAKEFPATPSHPQMPICCTKVQPFVTAKLKKTRVVLCAIPGCQSHSIRLQDIPAISCRTKAFQSFHTANHGRVQNNQTCSYDLVCFR